MTEIVNEDVVSKLFDQLAPRFMDRPGGYTRILRLGHRRGDGGEIAQIELLGSEYEAEEGRGGKSRQGSRGRGAETARASASGCARRRRTFAGRRDAKGGDATRGKAGKPAKGAAKKTTTPRKAGGS